MITRSKPKPPSGGEALSESARISRARLAEQGGHWGLAIAQYEALIGDPSTSADTHLAALRWLGRAHLENGNRNAAMDILALAVASAKEVNNGSAVAQALNVVAIVEQRGGDLERAARIYEEAREQAIVAGDNALVAMIDQNSGTVANIRGDQQAALTSFRLSLAGYQQLGMSQYSGQVLNNMGLAFAELGDLESAETAYKTALHEFSEHGDRTLMDEVAVNQVQLWIETKRFDDASRQSDLLLSSAEAESMPWIGEVHRHIGVIAREGADYARAEESLARAAAIGHESKDLLLSADVAEQRAELFWLQERHAEMLRSLNDARALYTRMNALNRVAQVERRNARLEHRFLDIARRWGDSIEGADRYTQGHCERVANIACALAEHIGIDSRDMFWFRLGALLHDVGKIIVPYEVLNKAGALTIDEWALMKKHPEAGLELVKGIDFPGDVLPMIRNHHERWDGKGYPDGLSGEATPLNARLLCLADVYDALTSARPYRTALTHSKGIDIMRSSAGQFDPRLLDAFIDWTEKKEKEQCA